MPQTYQLHQVIDVESGEHHPLLASRNSGVTMVPMTLSESVMQAAYAKGEREGANPLSRHPDGRVQVGEFVFVPEIYPGDVDPRTGRTTWS